MLFHGLDRVTSEPGEGVVEVLDEGEVIALEILHAAAHAGKTFAKTEIVSGIGFGRFAGGPIPIAAVLKVDDVDGMAADDGTLLLEAKIIHATEAFFEDLRPHDGAADGEDDAVIETFDGATKDLEIGLRGAADERAVEDGVVGNDIVADAGMDGERNVVAESRGEDGGVFPAVFKVVATLWNDFGFNQCEELEAGCVKWIFWKGGDELAEWGVVRQISAIGFNETTKCAAVAFSAKRPIVESDMNVARGFVPGAEGAGGDVLFDAFGRATEPGEFPVVDGAGAVGGEVGDPAVGHHFVEEKRGAVAEEMRAVDEHDRGFLFAGGEDGA